LHRGDIQPEKSLRQLNRQHLQTLMNVNAIGPLLAIKALAPLFDKRRPAILASLSARVGSISDNQLGGWHSYRASKAASNMLLKNLALEWRRSHPQALVAMLQPGTVDSQLSKPFQKNVPQLLTPDQSAQQLLKQLLQLSAEQSGCFIDWRGKHIAF
jgi:NAD(P)-dependent dehydrogenase (short-subunit alcohol dehydrogenase family)